MYDEIDPDQALRVGCQLDGVRLVFPLEYRVRLLQDVTVSPMPLVPSALLGMALVQGAAVAVLDAGNDGEAAQAVTVRAVMVESEFVRLAFVLDGDLTQVALDESAAVIESAPQVRLGSALVRGLRGKDGSVWWEIDPALAARLLTLPDDEVFPMARAA